MYDIYRMTLSDHPNRTFTPIVVTGRANSKQCCTSKLLENNITVKNNAVCVSLDGKETCLPFDYYKGVNEAQCMRVVLNQDEVYTIPPNLIVFAVSQQTPVLWRFLETDAINSKTILLDVKSNINIPNAPSLVPPTISEFSGVTFFDLAGVAFETAIASAPQGAFPEVLEAEVDSSIDAIKQRVATTIENIEGFNLAGDALVQLSDFAGLTFLDLQRFSSNFIEFSVASLTTNLRLELIPDEDDTFYLQPLPSDIGRPLYSGSIQQVIENVPGYPNLKLTLDLIVQVNFANTVEITQSVVSLEGLYNAVNSLDMVTTQEVDIDGNVSASSEGVVLDIDVAKYYEMCGTLLLSGGTQKYDSIELYNPSSEQKTINLLLVN